MWVTAQATRLAGHRLPATWKHDGAIFITDPHLGSKTIAQVGWCVRLAVWSTARVGLISDWKSGTPVPDRVGVRACRLVALCAGAWPVTSCARAACVARGLSAGQRAE